MSQHRHIGVPGVRARLAAVYKQVPDAGCVGLCANTCTTFPVPRVEARNVRRATGADIGLRPGNDNPFTRCPLLDEDGRCTGYDVRPLICRMWGAAIGMQCAHGCQPARLLTVAETVSLTADVYEIGGQHDDARRWRKLADGEPERFAPMLNAAARGGLTPTVVDAIVAEFLRQKGGLQL